MGVDYTANFGIGFKIKKYDDFEELIEENLNNKYSWFEAGDESYTGIENEHYIVVKEPFKHGFNNLETVKNELESHLIDIGLAIDGDFGVVGGLLIW